MVEQDDVERKLPVWHALSNLFVDNELEPDAYRRIAETLGRSGYSQDELRRILHEEVAPAFIPNLWSVAGNWTGWTEEQVREIVEREMRSARPFRWLRRRSAKAHVEEEWAKIAPLLG